MIPKIIHQTWKGSDLPPAFELFAATWKEYHPDWEYKLWTDEMMVCFVGDNYPEFVDRYNSYPKTIQRVDAFRYLLLLKEGGMYVDMDFECLENMDLLLEGRQCVIGKEPSMHCGRFSKEMILCNAWMASVPGDPFMQFVCERLADYPSLDVYEPKDVLDSTGPFLLTNSYMEYANKAEVTLLESDLLYPLTIVETEHVFTDTMTVQMEEKIEKAYAVHYFFGTW